LQGAQGATGATGPTGPQGVQGVGLGWGFFYTPFAAPGTPVPPGGTVNLTVPDPNSTAGFNLVGGGVQVPNNGIYLIYYQLAVPNAGVASSIALVGSSTNGIIDGSAFANALDTEVIPGSIIIPLRAGEIVTIINNNLVSPFTPVITGTAATATVNFVEMTIMLLLITP
jgi:hypothetical protein